MTDKEYYELIQPYEDAMKLLLTRLEVLNHSIYKTKTGKPVHNIQYRIKKKDSIEEKLGEYFHTASPQSQRMHTDYSVALHCQSQLRYHCCHARCHD